MTKIFLKGYRLASDLRLFVQRTIHYAKPKVKIHSHDSFELVIVQKGTGSHIVENHSFEIHTGDTFIIPPGLQHYYNNIEHLTLMNFLFDPVILKLFIDDLQKVPGFQMLFNSAQANDTQRPSVNSMKIPEQALSEIMVMFDKILKEQTDSHSGSKTMMLVLFIELIINICRKSQPSNDKYYNHAHQISKAVNYMEKSYQDKITLESLAEAAGLTGSSFRRCFTHSMGISPIKYLLNLRLKKAALMLDSTQLSITEIAYRNGFNDSNYFIRQFKKIFGTTPLRYRAGDHGNFYIPHLCANETNKN